MGEQQLLQKRGKAQGSKSERVSLVWWSETVVSQLSGDVTHA